MIEGLEADSVGESLRVRSRATSARVRLDATNPIAFLALARHHVGDRQSRRGERLPRPGSRALRGRGRAGSAVDVWGIGLRAWIDRAEGHEAEADSRFEAARELSPEIWRDELLSADELSDNADRGGRGGDGGEQVRGVRFVGGS